ncbi:MAG: M4 family metallopeptidase [Polyangiaceae bacterium]
MRSLRSSSVVGVVPVLLSALLVGHTAVGQPLKPQRMKAQALLTTRAKLVPLKAAPPAGATAIGRRPQDVIVAKVGNTSAGSANDFAVQAATNDARGIHHSRLVQRVRGVPVFGSDAIVHLRADGSPEDTTDHLLRDVDTHVSQTTPTITAARATQAAEAAARCPGCGMVGDPPEVMLLPDGEDVKLVYRVQLERLGSMPPTRPIVFVDASSGAVVRTWENLETATGTSTYYGNVTFPTTPQGSTRHLEDGRTKVITLDYGGSSGSPDRFTDADDLWNAPNQAAGVDAQFGLTTTLAYLQKTFNYSGLDGNGGPGVTRSADGQASLVTAQVHYGTRYANAFWDGSTLTFGDGDGSRFGSLTSIDIVAHEAGHGVIQATSGLVYKGESGALNESFADVLGVLVEAAAFGETPDIWKLGERAYTPSNGNGDALRYLDDPKKGSQPDHYADRSTGSSDNGGVHTNSGIPNKAFHLLVKGGSHSKGGSMQGIGLQDAARIWFLAFTQYMSQTTNFAGARVATIDAAKSLFGATSPKVEAVGQAWTLVGVGSPEGPPKPNPTPTPTPKPNPTPTPTPTPPTNAVSAVGNGGFETSASPWTFSGSAFFTREGTIAHAGSGYAILGTSTSSIGIVSQRVPLPAGKPKSLTFAVNVSTRETSTKATDKLFVELRGDNDEVLGTIAELSNLDKSSSSAYTTKGPYSLAKYAGKLVKLQFRAVNDANTRTAFRIDSVVIQ